MLVCVTVCVSRVFHSQAECHLELNTHTALAKKDMGMHSHIRHGSLRKSCVCVCLCVIGVFNGMSLNLYVRIFQSCESSDITVLCNIIFKELIIKADIMKLHKCFYL